MLLGAGDCGGSAGAEDLHVVDLLEGTPLKVLLSGCHIIIA